MAKQPSATLTTWTGWIVTLLVPVALSLLGVRLMMTSAFLHFEYNLPGFPADPYGFTKDERLYWSHIAMEYLVNEAGIEFLGDLRFDDGSQVYNERELRHMVDVKDAIRVVLWVLRLSLIALGVMAVWAWQAGWIDQFRAALSRGGFLTAILVGVIIFFVLVSFGVFFVAFHEVFFEPDTWMFYFSDTLIRLFPERFWRDIFLYVGGFALAVGLALGFGLKNRK